MNLRKSITTAAALAVAMVTMHVSVAGANVSRMAAARPAAATLDTAVFAGGCFWGIEAVYRHVKGVVSAESGYSGGTTVSPAYEQVGSGTTGHAESVRVIFDPAQVTYAQLVTVFFAVHDPTELNRQGPDEGTQYRTAIFYRNAAQQQVATSAIAQLTKEKKFSHPIVTQVVAYRNFYKAEAYHQNYLALHPTEYYIVVNDQPKIKTVQKQFPQLYRN